MSVDDWWTDPTYWGKPSISTNWSNWYVANDPVLNEDLTSPEPDKIKVDCSLYKYVEIKIINNITTVELTTNNDNKYIHNIKDVELVNFKKASLNSNGSIKAVPSTKIKKKTFQVDANKYSVTIILKNNGKKIVQVKDPKGIIEYPFEKTEILNGPVATYSDPPIIDGFTNSKLTAKEILEDELNNKTDEFPKFGAKKGGLKWPKPAVDPYAQNFGPTPTSNSYDFLNDVIKAHTKQTSYWADEYIGFDPGTDNSISINYDQSWITEKAFAEMAKASDDLAEKTKDLKEKVENIAEAISKTKTDITNIKNTYYYRANCTNWHKVENVKDLISTNDGTGFWIYENEHHPECDHAYNRVYPCFTKEEKETINQHIIAVKTGKFENDASQYHYYDENSQWQTIPMAKVVDIGGSFFFYKSDKQLWYMAFPFSSAIGINTKDPTKSAAYTEAFEKIFIGASYKSWGCFHHLKAKVQIKEQPVYDAWGMPQKQVKFVGDIKTTPVKATEQYCLSGYDESMIHGFLDQVFDYDFNTIKCKAEQYYDKIMLDLNLASKKKDQKKFKKLVDHLEYMEQQFKIAEDLYIANHSENGLYWKENKCENIFRYKKSGQYGK